MLPFMEAIGPEFCAIGASCIREKILVRISSEDFVLLDTRQATTVVRPCPRRYLYTKPSLVNSLRCCRPGRQVGRAVCEGRAERGARRVSTLEAEPVDAAACRAFRDPGDRNRS